MSKAKREIRTQMRARRIDSSPDDLKRRSQLICARVRDLSVFSQARGVGLFWPMLERGEVDVRGLDTAARAADKLVYYPYLRRVGEEVQRGFRKVDDVEDLQTGLWPFAEPLADAPEPDPGELDLIVVPALAADVRGHRVGYGSAFYDAVLRERCPPAHSVVVVYEFEVLTDLPIDDFDRACDLVVTDERLVVPG